MKEIIYGGNYLYKGVAGLVRSMAVKKAYPVEKIRMVGICPLFVNTELVRTQMNSGNTSVSNKYKNTRLIEPEEVNCYFAIRYFLIQIGAAFRNAVVGAESGQMMVNSSNQ